MGAEIYGLLNRDPACLSGKDVKRPQLQAMLNHVREGDTVVVHSLDRLGRNLVDLRKLVSDLTGRGVKLQFVKENLIFSGEDSPMSNLLLSMLGAVAEFERALLLERQREGIAIAKRAGKYKGRKPSLNSEIIAELGERVAAGEKKSALATEFGVTRMNARSTYRVCIDYLFDRGLISFEDAGVTLYVSFPAGSSKTRSRSPSCVKY